MSSDRVINFSAGPSQIPLEVLEQTQRELLNIGNSGQSILELFHRGELFERILNEADRDLRQLLNIPFNYKILFLAMGATGQFAGVPLNLLESKSESPDYLITGRWSELALEEAKIYTKPNIVASNDQPLHDIPDPAVWKMNPKAPYFFYCDNETANGIEFPYVPEVHGDVPLVVDMSSNILTRPFDVSKFGVIFACAQKNCGTTGVTIVIIREDLLTREKVNPVPSIFNWKRFSEANNLLNTAPVFAIYVAGLVFKWTLKNGGVTEMAARCKKKSEMIYTIIDQSEGFYHPMVSKGFRSRVNIILTINPKSLQDKFIKETHSQGYIGLAGHRLVGGMRISLYNAISVEDTQKLANFMMQFMKENKQI
jgi:phosphoserine aminotransferase